MKIRKIILSILVFLIIWCMLNLLPVIPVEYTNANVLIIDSLPKTCSLNYMLSCFDSRDDFGITYPIFLTSSIWLILVVIILPILLTWLIVRITINSKRFKHYFSK